MLTIKIQDRKIIDLQNVIDWASTTNDGFYTITRWRNARTNEQNRYYRGLIDLIKKHTGIDSEEIHEKMRMQFLSVAIGPGKLPYCKSTSKLDTKEFTEYIENIKNFMAERIGLVLPNADEWENFINNDSDADTPNT